MAWQEDALKRLRALTEYGGEGVDYGTSKGVGYFYGWRTQAIAALQSILGDGNVYTIQFAKVANYQNGPDAGIPVLLRAISDIENGYLRKTSNIISAEVFSDFLEMADHLLKQGYKMPAASLCGAVLEDGLRRMVMNTSDLKVNQRDDLNSLRDKLYGKGIFNNIVRQQVTSWTSLRNEADHGNFNAYDEAQVRLMIEGVRSFLATHLV
jgi:hypothetical protein